MRNGERLGFRHRAPEPDEHRNALAQEARAARARPAAAAEDPSRLLLAGVRVLVNDRCDVALASGAAGVHLGDEDLSVEAARRLAAAAGRGDFVVGYSTHSPEEAAQASQGGADYLGFGPVFESPTKAGVRAARGLDLLAAACRASRLPVVAIGGITVENCGPLIAAGADFLAVAAGVWDYPTGPAAAVKAFNTLF